MHRVMVEDLEDRETESEKNDKLLQEERRRGSSGVFHFEEDTGAECQGQTPLQERSKCTE